VSDSADLLRGQAATARRFAASGQSEAEALASQLRVLTASVAEQLAKAAEFDEAAATLDGAGL